LNTTLPALKLQSPVTVLGGGGRAASRCAELNFVDFLGCVFLPRRMCDKLTTACGWGGGEDGCVIVYQISAARLYIGGGVGRSVGMPLAATPPSPWGKGGGRGSF
jgi:hypothetical protein